MWAIRLKSKLLSLHFESVQILVYSNFFDAGLRQDLKSRRNPRLVPYALLDERTKKSNRDSLREAIRTLVGYGYDIDPPDQEGKLPLCHGFIHSCLLLTGLASVFDKWL